jgi:murein DD-endopeptidase MepM/ murein hydrolase activator NlpD
MRAWLMLIFGGACVIALMFALSGQGRLTPPSLAEPASAGSAAASASSQVEASPAETIPVPQSASTVSGSPAVPTSTSLSLDQIAALPPAAVDGLLIPVVGVRPGELTDTFTDARSHGRVHDAIDIMAPRGTPVVAVNDGHVVKLFTSVRGGLTVYQFDPQDHVIYYYAHLDSYAPGLAEGQVLHRGDPIGLVGSTGNASADGPHLHFEIEILGPKKQWWHATSINPYGRFAGQP